MKRFFAALLYIITGILVFLVALIGFAGRWAFSTWGEIDMDEIIFHLQNPLEGTGGGMIGSYLLKGLLPAVAVLAVYILLIIFLKKGKRRIICALAFIVLLAVSAFFVKNMIWTRLDLGEWIEARLNRSTFIEDHYADPAEVKLSFPERKRNLIYIYLESIETTYADEASGGAFSKNTIPELTEIAMENEDFSGNYGSLNGGIVLPGCGYTSGAIFAQSAGLPLKVSVSGNFMDTKTSFFPQVTALGDILEKEGYRQVYLLGSDATFGGRRLYYTDHGNVEIRDYLYAKEAGWIDEDYEVFWGYEDAKLFGFAKETLAELAQGAEPFALTLLTVDTHYEDGYVCDLCRDDFAGDQYANVMACSSRQIAAFLDWLKEQDFYDNTTVVLCGDHTTMDMDFCDNVPADYQRKVYTAFINSAAESGGEARSYSTFDLFPTTLSAMGVAIEGGRLGLGTDLFSNEKTLVEEYGKDELAKELARGSDFLEQLEKPDAEETAALKERFRVVFEDAMTVENYDAEKGTLDVRVSSLLFYDGLADESLSLDPKKLEVEYQEAGSSDFGKIKLAPNRGEAYYYGSIDISSWSSANGELRLNLYTKDGSVFRNIASVPVP